MSGSGGQQGYQTQRSTSTSDTGPPMAIRSTLNDIQGQLSGFYQANPTAPEFFPGSTVAGFTPQMQGGINALTARGGFSSPALGAAGRNITDTLSGGYLDLESNPYFFSALDASLAPQTEQFMEQVIPGITSAFTGSGRTGSGIHQQIVENATRDLSRAQADARVKAASDAYGFERGMMGQAAGLAPTVASTASGIDLSNIQALLQAGQITQQQAQALVDEQVQRYNYEQTAQPNWLTQYAQQLQSIYPGGSSQGTNISFGNSFMPSQGGGTSDVLGGIMGGAGLALQALPLLGLSDARAKDIHSRVGETDEGLPLYLYTLKGDGEPRVGPVAQEVAQFRPDAVARHPSGFLMVDYHKAMPVGGLL